MSSSQTRKPVALSSALRVAHINANSLRQYHDIVAEFLVDKKIDILSVCETWLTPDIDSSAVFIPNFHLARNDRGLKPTRALGNIVASEEAVSRRAFVQGGGVCVYVHKGIKCKMLQISQITTIDETEFLIVELDLENDERFLFATVYRRPQGHVLSEFFLALSHYLPLYNNVIIAGDFNSNLLDPDNFHGAHLTALIQEYSLYVIPSGTSHHGNFSDTWLDAVIVNNPNILLRYEKSSAPFIRGHDYIIVDFK